MCRRGRVTVALTELGPPLERHVSGADAALPAICQVQVAIASGDIVGCGEAEAPRRAVDPSRAAFQFEKVPDRRFVKEHLASSRTPPILSPELFVSKDRMIADVRQ